MNILKALDQLEKFESRIARLYEWFSENLKEDAEASAFFYRMSVDEIAHANLVKYQRRLVSANMKLFADIEIDLDGVMKAIARVEAVLSEPPLTADEAVRIALDLENDAAETHYRSLAEKAGAGIANLLTSLNAFDCRHSKFFEDFAAKRGQSSTAAPKPECVSPSAPQAAAAVAEPEEIPPELASRIERIYLRHEKMDLYEILDVRDYATPDQIKRAFRARAHEFHPDKMMNTGETVKRKLTAIFGSMTNAYSTLMDPVRRREYDNRRIRAPRR